MNKAVFALVAILYLLSVSSITGLIHLAKADGGTVYIRADGSIDPPTAPISTIDNVTYVFTGNTNDSVVVERDNIVINGSGYTLSGIWSYSRGIDLTGRSNITINDINILAFEYGIYLSSSSNVNISRNNLTDDSAAAICINSSSNNNANGNILTTNFIGIFLESSSSNNSASENNIVGDTTDYGSARFFYGIEIVSSSNNTLNENMITNNDDGIDLYSSSNNSIIGNDIIKNNYFGGSGIFLSNSTSNGIEGNNIANNYNGVTVDESSNNNSLIGNNITASESWGVGLDSSSGNCLYHNNIINNTNQVVSGLSANVWDAGYSSGGNYWSDYTGTDNNQDGIGDTPYLISYSNDADHYPLMGAFQSFNVSLYEEYEGLIQNEEVDIISNSTIGQVYLSWADDARNPPTYMDWFLVLSGFAGQNGTVGFCRITLPNDILNSTSYHVGTMVQYVNDNLTISKVLSSNGTYTTLYFTYEVPNPTPFPEFEIIIIPEFPSLIVLSLFMIATLLAVVVYKKKVMKNKLKLDRI